MALLLSTTSTSHTVCPVRVFVHTHYARCIRFIHIIHFIERYVLFRFHLQSHLLAPCQAISCYCAIYIVHIAYILVRPQMHPLYPHTLYEYMFIHTAADDSNQDNKNKYYTIFDCVRPLAKLRNSFSYLTAHNSHFISISQTSTYICIYICIRILVCICSRIVFLFNFV